MSWHSGRAYCFLPALILTGLLLTACGQGSKVPQDHYYRLNLASPPKLAQPTLSGTLAVKRFAANGLLQGRGITHSQPGNPSEIESYHYHHWIDIPPLMLQELLLGYLQAASVASDIVAGDGDIKPDYLIKGRIKRLEHITGSPSEGLIELDLSLIQSDSRTLILHRVYQQKVRTSKQTITATVMALNHALEKIYAAFLEDLARIPDKS
ncbi:MAG: ABC-type transport auxiliary lipoprotein family protein [Mariprofundaceae bacterium]